MSSPAGILFDAYGTLFDVHSVAALAESLHPGSGAALTTLWREKQLDYSRLRSMSGRYVDFDVITADALDHALEKLRLAPSPAGRQRLLDQYAVLAPHPEVVPVLERLRQTGRRLAILSNGNSAMLARVVGAAGMTGLFDHILGADRVRRFKTAPEVYALGTAAFDCPAESLVFVSANCWDACGAAAFGFRSLWVNRAGDPVDRLGIPPTAQGRSMLDLPAFLGLP